MPMKKDNLRRTDKLPNGQVEVKDAQFVKYYNCSLDTFYPGLWPPSGQKGYSQKEAKAPRLANGCFIIALKALFKVYYGYDMEMNAFGKPYTTQYQYAENHLKEVTKMDSIKRFYMIGDSLSSDVKGAFLRNQEIEKHNKSLDENGGGAKIDKKWISIAVKTGLFQGTEAELEEAGVRPDFVVEEFLGAIDHILNLEGVK